MRPAARPATGVPAGTGSNPRAVAGARYRPPVEEPFPAHLVVDGCPVPLAVARRPVKHLSARLRGGRILVSAPLRAPRPWIDESLPVLARRLLRSGRKRDLNRDGAALAAARRVAARFPEPPAVRTVEFVPGRPSLWGSWHPASGTVRLSAALLHMPPRVLESVVAHELCHVRWRSHGERFRSLLRRVDPHADWSRGFLDGATWLARTGELLPESDRGPLETAPDQFRWPFPREPLERPDPFPPSAAAE